MSRVFIGKINKDLIQKRDEFVASLTKEIKKTQDGYAGFKTKKDLIGYLSDAVYGDDAETPKNQKTIKEEEIKKIVLETIAKCQKVINSNRLNIFIFPTFSKFVKTEMSGVTGYTPWKGNILIFINFASSNWKRSLASTIAHEYLHSLTFEYHKWETLLDSLVFEGLAEHFKEAVIVGPKPKWVKALKKSEMKEIFKGLFSKMDNKSFSLYQEVFFGSKKYPRWSGYAIGYWLVGEYLKKLKVVDWNKLVKIKPKEFLK